MKLKNTRLGFTLIELLVVITIIGILATGAVSVYTSQIQKARDSVRLTDVTAVKAGVEQFYQDKAEYPHSSNLAASITAGLAFEGIKIYTPKLPQDPKSSNLRVWAAFDYIYTVWSDVNWISWQDFEVSTTFENQWNVENKAVWDWWNDAIRLELWIDLANNNTDVTAAIAPTVTAMQCVVVWWTTTACTTEWTRLVIRKQ